MNIATQAGPTSLKAALHTSESKEWFNAAEQEYQALIHNKTFELVPISKGHKPVNTQWVFTHKYKADDTFNKYKARWVACGFIQLYGIDYEETFTPALQIENLYLLLAWAVQQG